MLAEELKGGIDTPICPSLLLELASCPVELGEAVDNDIVDDDDDICMIGVILLRNLRRLRSLSEEDDKDCVSLFAVAKLLMLLLLDSIPPLCPKRCLSLDAKGNDDGPESL